MQVALCSVWFGLKPDDNGRDGISKTKAEDKNMRCDGEIMGVE